MSTGPLRDKLELTRALEAERLGALRVLEMFRSNIRYNQESFTLVQEMFTRGLGISPRPGFVPQIEQCADLDGRLTDAIAAAMGEAGTFAAYRKSLELELNRRSIGPGDGG